MKKFFVLALVFCLMFSACSKKEEPKQDEKADAAAASADAGAAAGAAADADAAKAPAAAPDIAASPKDVENAEARALLDSIEMTESGLKSLLKDEKTLLAKEYEALILARGVCKDDPNTSARLLKPDACETRGSVRRGIIDGREISLEDRHEVLSRLKRHPDIAVRGAAIAALFSEPYKKDPKELAEAMYAEGLECIQKESDPTVICESINESFYAPSFKAYREWYAKQLSSDNDAIRKCAAAHSIFLKDDVPREEAGLFRDSLVKLLDDSDDGTVQLACKALGGFADANAVKVISDHIMVQDDPKRITEPCLEGLIALWSERNSIEEETLKAAYDATLKYLKEGKHTTDVDLEDVLPTRNSINSIKSKRAFINEADIVAALADIAKNSALDVNVRVDAINAIGGIGKKADVQSIESVTADKDNGEELKKAYDKALSNAKE